MSGDPKPGDCYTRRWFEVERAEEQRHMHIRLVGMGEDKPLVAATRCGTWQDVIMTRIALDAEWLPCPADAHKHLR